MQNFYWSINSHFMTKPRQFRKTSLLSALLFRGMLLLQIKESNQRSREFIFKHNVRTVHQFWECSCFSYKQNNFSSFPRLDIFPKMKKVYIWFDIYNGSEILCKNFVISSSSHIIVKVSKCMMIRWIKWRSL